MTPPARPAILHLLMLLLVLALSNCSAAARRPHTPRPPPGMVRIVVHDNLAWPFELERVVVVLDGTALYNRRDPPSPPLDVAFLRAVQGEHVVQMLVEASYASGSVGRRCVIDQRASRSFVVGASGVSVDIDVHATDWSRDFPARLGITWQTSGEPPRQDSSPPPAKATQGEVRRCMGLEAVAEALCRAEAQVEHGRITRNVILVLCSTDKREQMALAARSIRENEAVARGGGPDASHAQGIEAALRQRIAQLQAELAQCNEAPEPLYVEPVPPQDACASEVLWPSEAGGAP